MGYLADLWGALRNGLSYSEFKQIRAGLADVEAGRTKPLDEVRQELEWKRIERERIRRQEVCSDKSHWKSDGDN